ncbi:MAG TPA: M48 family metalloprotease [Stellaceae bacterium]|nr:M48 family metalloprotease [Stellaceae bacterium]
MLRSPFRQVLCAGLVATVLIASPASPRPAAAQDSGGVGTGVGLIRDAEIESTIRTFATPLWRAAGLDASFIQINLVNSSQINAFVAGGQRLFINTGLLTRSQSPNQVIGVIAHETGHIAGGHLARSQEALENATTQSIIGYVLGTAGAVLSRSGAVASAAVLGTQSMALRSLLAYSVGQEARADQAGMTFLDETNQSSRGLLEFFQVLEKQEVLLPARQDPYLRTHPLTTERVDTVRAHVEKSPASKSQDSPELVMMHHRMVAKLVGFLAPIADVMKRYPLTDQSLPAHYARAIAYYRKPDLPKALEEINGLLKDHPDDPYFNELKGQMLFENGKVKEALLPYQTAAKLAPQASLIRVSLAQVQLEMNDPSLVKPAIAALKDAVRTDPDNSDAWHFLAIAQGRDNDIGNAALALAEEAVLAGDIRTAIQQASRATQLLPRGSPGWLRADDISRDAKATRNRS